MRRLLGAYQRRGSPLLLDSRGEREGGRQDRHDRGFVGDELASGALEWLQLLVHPEIWVYEGTTMRETMEKMLEAKRNEWVEALIDDRIDMT